jgi:general secretion pathway protein E
MQQNPRFIAELLKRRGNVAVDRIDEAVEQIERDGKGQKLTDVLIRQGVDESDLAQALAEAVGLPALLEIPQDGLPLEFIRESGFDLGFARQNNLVPIAITDNGVLVAVADPFNTFAIDDLRSMLDRDVETVVSTPSEIVGAINFVQTRIGAAGELADEGGLHGEEEVRTEILESDDDAQIIRWVNSLFIEAIRDRATDIHIQPDELEVAVRYRIDGELYRADNKTVPKRFLPSIVARVKVMSGLNIAEKRLPQDGRIGFKMAGKAVDIRVSTIPIGQGAGERIVMRILNKSSIMLELTDLGFAPDRLEIMHGLIARPDGIVLVTGPTGSGKTTTLYACLNRMNQPNLNILTAEDPIEYDLRGISQMQMNEKIGLTFASSLRAFLRQDPDVIMVGEIRDKETAEIAIQASLTGHLVLSTIHTNDAAGAVTRLLDFGLESFQLASTLVGLLAQRLVRVLCPHCKEPHAARESDLARLGLDRVRLTARLAREQTVYGRSAFGGSPAATVANDLVMGRPAQIYAPKGCPECQGTGYRGRTGIYELLLVTDSIRSHMLKNSDSVTIRRAGIEEGMDTLLDDGARKVLEGFTTVEEVLAAKQGEF